MLGIIGGTGLFHAEIPPLDKKTIATPYGPAEIWLGDMALVMRHQHATSCSLKYGEGNGTPLQHSCLENPMDRGAW